IRRHCEPALRRRGNLIAAPLGSLRPIPPAGRTSGRRSPQPRSPEARRPFPLRPPERTRVPARRSPRGGKAGLAESCFASLSFRGPWGGGLQPPPLRVHPRSGAEGAVPRTPVTPPLKAALKRVVRSLLRCAASGHAV